MADRIMIIDGGEIKKIGTKDEVLPYLNGVQTVSYTHLDVYKRQEQYLHRQRKDKLSWILSVAQELPG